MSIQVKDATGTAINLATGAGDGGATPYQSPAAVGIGTPADAAVTNPALSASLIALLKGLISLPGTSPLPIYDGYVAPATTTWTSGTAINTVFSATTQGMDTVILTFVPTGTITGGVATFEVYDGATWLPIKVSRIESYATEGSYNLTGSTRAWQIPVAGFPQFRVRLSTVISGSGSAGWTIIVSSAPDTSVVTVGLDPAQPLPAGEIHLGEVGGRVANPSANFNRPANATAYASGNLVANSTTAGSVVPLSITATRVNAGNCLIRRVRLTKSGTSATNAAFRVHFYSSSPTPANGDGGAWSTSGAANYLGYFDVLSMLAFTDGCAGQGIPGVGSEAGIALGSGQTVYALIEARGAYAPASGETFTLVPEILQN